MAFRTNNREGRAALTLVEVLVAVACISILLAIVLSAVQAARESSRKASCLNNLHQIGIAVANFHQKERALPLGQFVYRQLAGELELKTRPDYDWGSLVALVPPVLRCPSESNIAGEDHVNYFMNIGSSIRPLNGVVSPSMSSRSKLRKTTFAEIVDGLSNTSLLSEHLQIHVHCNNCPPSTRWWQASQKFSEGQEDELRTYLTTAWQGRRLNEIPGTTFFASTVVNDDFFIDHLWAPNTPMVMALDMSFGAVQGPSSAHGSCVSVLFADSSVRFINDEIDSKTWSAIGSRNGGEHAVIPQ